MPPLPAGPSARYRQQPSSPVCLPFFVSEIVFFPQGFLGVPGFAFLIAIRAISCIFFVALEEHMNGTRRRFFQDAALFGAGLFGLSAPAQAQSQHETQQSGKRASSARASASSTKSPPP